eukprot:TRINITY_DN9286_c0_g4_i1.p1 TRINITY_DN9286_c0_g4~~TRINITY_DN9286_c0_g4_i1.p1  ORF type:complete len:400 (+),score=80.92 TRINITY_DN9286_c0_g4_i1:510-1709(+)
MLEPYGTEDDDIMMVSKEFKPPPQKIGLKMLMESAQEEGRKHPQEIVVMGSRVGADGTYKRTDLKSEGVPIYSRLGDMAWMAVQDGRWVLWAGSDKRMIRSAEEWAGQTPLEMGAWEEKKSKTKSQHPEGFMEKDRIRVFELPELVGVPHRIRAGPWSPVAVLAITLLGAGLGGLAVSSHNDYPFVGSPDQDITKETWGGIWRLVLGLYCLVLFGIRLRITPDRLQRTIMITSYTMTSWNIMTLRLITAGLSTWVPWLERPAEILRFPALCGASVTVGIWWLIIVPMALLFVLSDERQKQEFIRWQTDFFLLNVHALNLVFMGLDHAGIGGGRRLLTPTDLLLAIGIGVFYLCFYLGFHDPRGYHIYLVLSPRLHTCIFVYAFIFGLFYSVWCAWKEVH